MGTSGRSLLLIAALLLLASCRIELDVSDRGTVDSVSGAYSCGPGEACEISVVDAHFDETFTATPAPGFVFREWRRREGGLCGGNMGPCRIVTAGFDSNPDLVAVLESDALFYLEPVFVRPEPPYEVEIHRNLAYVTNTGGSGGGRSLDVYAAQAPGRRPAVLLLHGGSGDKDQQAYIDVALQLAEAGVVVFSVDHSLRVGPGTATLDDGAVVRAALEETLCALRYVAGKGKRYGADRARITVLGQSAGGLIGGLGALGGPRLHRQLLAFNQGAGLPLQRRCVASAMVPEVAGFASFNGALFIFAPVSPLSPSSNPELVDLLNPATYLDRAPDKLRLRMLLGALDSGTPQWHKNAIRTFAEQMESQGHNSRSLTIADAGHDFVTTGPAWDKTLNVILAVTGR